MKKLWLILLVLSSYSVSGQQRLALLPQALTSTVSTLSQGATLCIDFFQPVPKGSQELHFIGGEASQSNLSLNGANTYKHARVNGTRTVTNNIAYFGASGANEAVPAYYKEFIELRTQYYTNKVRAGGVTKVNARDKLQKDVWEFNILDQLGYVNQNEAMASEFDIARSRFTKNHPEMGAKATASLIGEEIEYLGAYHTIAQKKSNFKFKNYIIHYERGKGKYLVFDGGGHLIANAGNSQNAIGSILQLSSDNENIYINPINFENDKTTEAFLTNANIEGYKNGRKISFHNYAYQDVMTGGRRYSIPKHYNAEDITTVMLEDREYSFLASKFHEKTTYLVKGEIEVDTYSTKPSILQDMVTQINRTFDIGERIDNAKQSISLAEFLSGFKKRVKTIHGLGREDEFMMIIKHQMKEVGVVKLIHKKNGINDLRLIAMN